MKKIFIVLLVSLFMAGSALPLFADRNVPTISAYTSNTLVKRGNWKIYRITFVATTNGGSFTIYDSTSAGTGSNTNVKAEGSEASSLNGKTLDFTGKPLEGSTGLYLVVDNANVIVEYE